jgi:uncharacterized membrane protein YkoI
LRESDSETRHFYAEVIIGMIGEKNSLKTMISTCYFYYGKFGIKKRLESIIDTTKKMKWPTTPLLSAVITLILLSGSVFQRLSAMESPLTVSQGIEIALIKVGGGTVDEFEFWHQNGVLIYNITILQNNQRYDVKINSMTGEIIDFVEELTPTPAQIDNYAQISFENAIEIAIARFSKGSKGVVEQIELEYENGVLIYEIKIRHRNRLYEVKINASTGAIIEVNG